MCARGGVGGYGWERGACTGEWESGCVVHCLAAAIRSEEKAKQKHVGGWRATGPCSDACNHLPCALRPSSATLLGKCGGPALPSPCRRREGKGGGGAAVLSPAVSKWLKSLGSSEAAVGGITWDKILTKNKKVGPVAWEGGRDRTWREKGNPDGWGAGSQTVA